MAASDYAAGTEEKQNGKRPFGGFLFGSQQTAVVSSADARARPRPRKVVQVAPWSGLAELVVSLSGVGLALFMFMHLGLLFSVVLGSSKMDSLAAFLEDNYLLQAGAPVLIVILAVHVIMTSRKVPTTVRQQIAMGRSVRRLRHFDTWTWAFQVISGTLMLVLAAIHLWIILTHLPIEAATSSARVHHIYYLVMYAPFVVLAETHTSLGLYRVAVKWGLIRRDVAHISLTLWGATILAIGFTILATFYSLGGGQ